MADISKLEQKLKKALLKAKVGDDIILSSKRASPVKGFSTGIITLDVALSGKPGIGFAYGRIVEIYGPEMSGKTTLALTLLAQAQKEGLLTAFIDMEQTLDQKYASDLGIDRNNVSVAQPECGEDAVKLVEVMLETGYRFIVIDSVAAMIPKSELHGEPGDAHIGRLARLMGQATRKISVKAAKAEAIVVFINQIRAKVGPMGAGETTPGGFALKFTASYRLDIRSWRKGKRLENGVEVGIDSVVRVVKNKMFPPHRQAKLRILYGTGFDLTYDLLEFLFGKKGNAKRKIGKASYTRKGLLLKLARNTELRDKLRARIMRP